MSESNDLGPKPEPEIEPGQPNPGGVDATPPTGEVDIPRDLDPNDNPAVEDALPDEMKRGEDTTTEATKSDGDEPDVPPTEESPA
ncbi:hypothetical protein BH11ACT8_BH11ACT8_14390 [soil metagenome]